MRPLPPAVEPPPGAVWVRRNESECPAAALMSAAVTALAGISSVSNLSLLTKWVAEVVSGMVTGFKRSSVECRRIWAGGTGVLAGGGTAGLMSLGGIVLAP